MQVADGMCVCVCVCSVRRSARCVCVSSCVRGHVCVVMCVSSCVRGHVCVVMCAWSCVCVAARVHGVILGVSRGHVLFCSFRSFAQARLTGLGLIDPRCPGVAQRQCVCAQQQVVPSSYVRIRGTVHTRVRGHLYAGGGRFADKLVRRVG